MKVRIIRRKNFLPCLRYVSDREKKDAGKKDAEYICGTVPHSSVNEMVHELLLPLSVKSVKKPVYHVSLSMPKGEPRRNREEWTMYADAFLRKIGFPAEVPYCVYRHKDTECDHVHIVASRVALDGSVYQGGMDVFKAIEATQEIEKEYGLTRTKGLGKTRRRLELNEMKMMEKTQKLSDKQLIKVYVEKSLSKSSTMEEFKLNLTDYGITVRLNTAQNGRVSGISFQRGDFAVKGSKLGSKYSYTALSRRLPSIMEINIGNEQTLSKQREHTRTR